MEIKNHIRLAPSGVASLFPQCRTRQSAIRMGQVFSPKEFRDLPENQKCVHCQKHLLKLMKKKVGA